jgi:hypothetical protein
MIKGLKKKPCKSFYATIKNLVEYSNLVTSILPLSCIPPSIGTIEEDPKPPVPHYKDCLAYWDNVNPDICYGRYLIYKKVIKFWFGLSATPEKANLIIWFEKGNFPVDNTDYVKALRDKFELKKQCNESQKEVWIAIMEDKDFEKFCNNNSSDYERKKIIKDFWQSVLGELN